MVRQESSLKNSLLGHRSAKIWPHQLLWAINISSLERSKIFNKDRFSYQVRICHLTPPQGCTSNCNSNQSITTGLWCLSKCVAADGEHVSWYTRRASACVHAFSCTVGPWNFPALYFPGSYWTVQREQTPFTNTFLDSDAWSHQYYYISNHSDSKLHQKVTCGRENIQDSNVWSFLANNHLKGKVSWPYGSIFLSVDMTLFSPSVRIYNKPQFGSKEKLLKLWTCTNHRKE